MPDSPGGATLARAYGLCFLPLPVGEGRGEGTRPHRRLIRPAALRLHGPTGWVFSLSPWERAGVRASGRIVA
ncbi:hypothetical protein FJMB80055_36330 [Enterobacter hormaechei]|nr:hypothetical protein OIPHN069_04860 [Enterobacter hormaechei subsp. hoffmannii]BDI76815.1 hypothetical protein FJMB80001_04860 [Enterobacter hormaechei]GJJ92961.1 hypothetical protein TUM16654_12410 [Enterobacter cloacae]BDI81778.1 hypothetical protein FJMB80002_04860 [Enterobacter hormaechei]BDI86682.1 hypothetical protein FJMB80003_04900 [Enterobacter hormaechei]